MVISLERIATVKGKKVVVTRNSQIRWVGGGADSPLSPDTYMGVVTIVPAVDGRAKFCVAYRTPAGDRRNTNIGYINLYPTDITEPSRKPTDYVGAEVITVEEFEDHVRIRVGEFGGGWSHDRKYNSRANKELKAIGL